MSESMRNKSKAILPHDGSINRGSLGIFQGNVTSPVMVARLLEAFVCLEVDIVVATRSSTVSTEQVDRGSQRC